MQRRILKVIAAGLIICAWLASFGGCQPSAPPKRKLAIVFVDVSASPAADDWRIYRRSYDALVNTLKPGDRLVLGNISAKTMTGFTAIEDVALPSTGVMADDEDSARVILPRLHAAFSQLEQQPRSSQTCIVGALNVAKDFFQADRIRTDRELLLFSDMMEDCEGLNFATTTLDPAQADKIIARWQTQHSIPDLNGVRIYAAGASASTQARMLEVRTLWMKAFKVTGAVCDTGMYVRDGLQFSSQP